MAKRKSKKSIEKLDLLGMGIIPFDLLFTVKKYPSAGHKIDAESFTMQGGGPVPNVAVGVSRLGFNTALIAPVGDDPFGKLMLDELKKDSVDTSYMLIKREPTALASGWIEQTSGNRTMVLSRKIQVKPSDLILKNLPLPKILHLDGRDMPATLKLAKWAKRNNIIVSFDIGSMRNDVSEVFPYVDHLVVADAYALPFTNSKTARSAIKKLRAYCNGTIIVTEGIRGSVGQDSAGRAYLFQPAYKVKNVDTTGAGDCYHTGYLYGLLKGYPLAERMKVGSAAAALKCTKPGARTGIPTEDELLRFLKSKPKRY